MDILSHGLWGVIGGKFLCLRKFNLSLKWSFFWGVFPDLFAFLPLTLWARIFGLPTHPPHSLTDATVDTLPLFIFTNTAYKLSHSLLIIAIIILIIWTLKKTLYLSLLAWPLHILMDIPTHTAIPYGTPFLWPLPHPIINGITWRTPWFMIVNVTALLVAYFLLFSKKK